MTRAELIREWEMRRLEAERHGATAPLARTYAIALEELRALDGAPQADRLMTTAEAAEALGLAPKTVAKWAGEGRFGGAMKTSEYGEWRLPSRAVYAVAGASTPNLSTTSVTRLWKEGTDG